MSSHEDFSDDDHYVTGEVRRSFSSDEEEAVYDERDLLRDIEEEDFPIGESADEETEVTGRQVFVEGHEDPSLAWAREEATHALEEEGDNGMLQTSPGGIGVSFLTHTVLDSAASRRHGRAFAPTLSSSQLESPAPSQAHSVNQREESEHVYQSVEEEIEGSVRHIHFDGQASIRRLEVREKALEVAPVPVARQESNCGEEAAEDGKEEDEEEAVVAREVATDVKDVPVKEGGDRVSVGQADVRSAASVLNREGYSVDRSVIEDEVDTKETERVNEPLESFESAELRAQTSRETEDIRKNDTEEDSLSFPDETSFSSEGRQNSRNDRERIRRRMERTAVDVEGNTAARDGTVEHDNSSLHKAERSVKRSRFGWERRNGQNWSLEQGGGGSLEYGTQPLSAVPVTVVEELKRELSSLKLRLRDVLKEKSELELELEAVYEERQEIANSLVSREELFHKALQAERAKVKDDLRREKESFEKKIDAEKKHRQKALETLRSELMADMEKRKDEEIEYEVESRLQRVLADERDRIVDSAREEIEEEVERQLQERIREMQEDWEAEKKKLEKESFERERRARITGVKEGQENTDTVRRLKEELRKEMRLERMMTRTNGDSAADDKLRSIEVEKKRLENELQHLRTVLTSERRRHEEEVRAVKKETTRLKQGTVLSGNPASDGGDDGVGSYLSPEHLKASSSPRDSERKKSAEAHHSRNENRNKSVHGSSTVSEDPIVLSAENEMLRDQLRELQKTLSCLEDNLEEAYKTGRAEGEEEALRKFRSEAERKLRLALVAKLKQEIRERLEGEMREKRDNATSGAYRRESLDKGSASSKQPQIQESSMRERSGDGRRESEPTGFPEDSLEQSHFLPFSGHKKKSGFVSIRRDKRETETVSVEQQFRRSELDREVEKKDEENEEEKLLKRVLAKKDERTQQDGVSQLQRTTAKKKESKGRTVKKIDETEIDAGLVSGLWGKSALAATRKAETAGMKHAPFNDGQKGTETIQSKGTNETADRDTPKELVNQVQEGQERQRVAASKAANLSRSRLPVLSSRLRYGTAPASPLREKAGAREAAPPDVSPVERERGAVGEGRAQESMGNGIVSDALEEAAVQEVDISSGFPHDRVKSNEASEEDSEVESRSEIEDRKEDEHNERRDGERLSKSSGVFSIRSFNGNSIWPTATEEAVETHRGSSRRDEDDLGIIADEDIEADSLMKEEKSAELHRKEEEETLRELREAVTSAMGDKFEESRRRPAKSLFRMAGTERRTFLPSKAKKDNSRKKESPVRSAISQETRDRTAVPRGRSTKAVEVDVREQEIEEKLAIEELGKFYSSSLNLSNFTGLRAMAMSIDEPEKSTSRKSGPPSRSYDEVLKEMDKLSLLTASALDRAKGKDRETKEKRRAQNGTTARRDDDEIGRPEDRKQDKEPERRLRLTLFPSVSSAELLAGRQRTEKEEHHHDTFFFDSETTVDIDTEGEGEDGGFSWVRGALREEEKARSRIVPLVKQVEETLEKWADVLVPVRSLHQSETEDGEASLLKNSSFLSSSTLLSRTPTTVLGLFRELKTLWGTIELSFVDREEFLLRLSQYLRSCNPDEDEPPSALLSTLRHELKEKMEYLVKSGELLSSLKERERVKGDINRLLIDIAKEKEDSQRPLSASLLRSDVETMKERESASKAEALTSLFRHLQYLSSSLTRRLDTFAGEPHGKVVTFRGLDYRDVIQFDNFLLQKQKWETGERRKERLQKHLRTSLFSNTDASVATVGKASSLSFERKRGRGRQSDDSQLRSHIRPVKEAL